MKSHRGIASTTLSNRVISYLVSRGYTQADIARMIGLAEGFVSLVKSRERGFTLEHLQLLADRFGMPLGAFLLAANPAKPKTPEGMRIVEMTERLTRQADGVIAAIKMAHSAPTTQNPVTAPR